MNKAHNTAITRRKPSVPMRNLSSLGLLNGTLLDFGSGKGFDATHFGMDKYDPHYSPQIPDGNYETITCNYVFNVVEKDQELNLIRSIQHLLEVGGKAYITVRRDIKTEGYTSKKTYQRNVLLQLPILKETSTYCTYILNKEKSCGER